MDTSERLSALSHPGRLAVLRWLKAPRRHFPRQEHADIDRVGVCCTLLTRKLRIAPATTTRHMKILADAGFVRAQRIGKFTYYRRVDAALRAVAGELRTL
ncbi:MAG TPA: helix-turn-helix transcriptional regulator [Rudaea sp.]|nr:helix-turn-helix transcriptional regulator [Rudaea sp.]